MDAAKVQERLRSAVISVATRQPELWRFKAGERAIVGQLFHELRAMEWLEGFSVDTEWEREGERGDPKGQSPSIAEVPPRNRTGAARPDIIVHVRGATGSQKNLLIAEFKPQPLGSTPADRDLEKVKRVMRRHGYLAGAVVSLGQAQVPRNINAYWLTDPDREPEILTLF